jgi:hypothetical protein
MAKKARLTRAAVKIGGTAGRISGKASKARKAAGVAAKELQRLKRNAQKEAAKELHQMSKAVDRIRRDLYKARQRLARSMR